MDHFKNNKTMKKIFLIILFVLTFIKGAYSQERIIDASVPDDWNQETFFDQVEMIELALQNKQYTSVIKWANAGIASTKINEENKAQLSYYKGKAKFELQDYNGAMLDVKKFTDYETKKRNITIAGYVYDEIKEQQIFDSFVFLISCYLTLEKNNEAIKIADLILKFRTQTEINEKKTSNKIKRNAWVYFMKGYARLQLKETEKACLNFSTAGDLGEEKAYEAIKKYCQK